MTFTKALKKAEEVAYDRGYSSYIYLENRDYMFEIGTNNKHITTIYKVDLKRKRLRSSGLNFYDILRIDWKAENCYGEEDVC